MLLRDEAFSVPLPPPRPSQSLNPSRPAGIVPLPSLPDGRFTTGVASRYLPDGTPDPDWNTPSLTRPGTVSALRSASEGTFLVAGEFDTIDGTPAMGLARFHSDGTLDPRFRIDATLAAPTFQDLFADGAILVSETSEPRSLLKLRPDGSLDESFRYAFGPREWLLDADVDSEGRVLVLVQNAEFLPSYNSLIRLLPDGERDPAFSHATRPPGLSFGFGSARPPVEPFLAGSYFAHAWWHREDGSRDQLLPAPFGAHLADGSVLLRDDPLPRPEPAPLLHRWHPERGLDPGFTSPFTSGTNGTVGTPSFRGSFLSLLHGLRDGRILTSGQLVTGRGTYRTLRLHPDGTPDFAFAAPGPWRVRPDVPGVEYLLNNGRLEPSNLAHRRQVSDVTSALELSDGTLVVGGTFTHLGSSRRTGLAALCSGVATTFEAWCAATFARTNLPIHLLGPDDDPDDDGATNFYEFAVGSDPLAANLDDIQPRLLGVDPPRWSVPRNPDAAGITLNVELSEDLQHWRVAGRDEVSVEEVGTHYLFSLHRPAARIFVRASFSISAPAP